jgi:hypothetical protein
MTPAEKTTAGRRSSHCPGRENRHHDCVVTDPADGRFGELIP